MTIKKQVMKIKENWLIVLLILLLLSGSIFLFIPATNMMSSVKSANYATDQYEQYRGSGSAMYYPQNDNFVPEVDIRKITKNSNLQTEVDHGDFNEAEQQLKSIISSTDSILLDENKNTYESGWKSYQVASYRIKVETSKYESILSQIKNIGEVKSFNENMDDITGRYDNLEIEIETEEKRLERYQEMMTEEDISINEKIELSDKIYSLERRIEYLKDSLQNLDNQISYSTIYVHLQEEKSEYFDVSLVKISTLIKSFISSFNFMLKLVFLILPYVILFIIVRLAVKLLKK